MNFKEYKDWRNKGVAFEVRLATYIKANKTMSSFISGNRSNLMPKAQKDQAKVAWCEVFGET